MRNLKWPLIVNQIRGGKKQNTYGVFKERYSGVHWGWDFKAEVGTICYSIADGVIEDVYFGAGGHKNGFGLVAVLKFNHKGRKLYAAYCHMLGVRVEKGTPVSAGDMIGFTGKSGNAHNLPEDQDHLHFEIRTEPRPPKGGAPFRIDPIEVFGHCPLNIPIIESE